MSKTEREKIAKQVTGTGNDGVHRLEDIDPEEVSIVNRGANKKKRFLIVKEDNPSKTEGKEGAAEGGDADTGEGTGGETSLADVLKNQLDPLAGIVKTLNEAEGGDVSEAVREQASGIVKSLAGGLGLVLVEKDADDADTGEGKGEGGGERSGVKKLDLKDGESYDAFRDKLRTALGDVRNDPTFGAMPMGGEDRYLYIMDVYNTFMIVENSEDWSYWKVPFSREADGTIVLALDQAAQVERVETYVPVAKGEAHWMTTMQAFFTQLNETVSGLKSEAGASEDVVKNQAANALKTIFGDAGIEDPVAFIKSLKESKVEKGAGPDLVTKIQKMQEDLNKQTETVKKQAAEIRKFQGLLIGKSQVENDEGGDGEGKGMTWPADMAADVKKKK